MRWSKEKIWSWYNARPWLRGCNYMSADCANRIDQWQALGFEERLKTTETELALMQETGYNTIRVLLEYAVWKEEHDSFMERFDRYLALAAKYGISVMVVLANDCMPPKEDNPDWKLPTLGEQTYDWGYHGGKKRSQHGAHTCSAPHFYLDDPAVREDYYEMVREIVTVHKNDERICVWDIYNEAGNSRRWEISFPYVKRIFEIVREVDPIQPLTAGFWSLNGSVQLPRNDIDTYLLENCDIISYHYYGAYTDHVKIIKQLKKQGRPLMNTEWLGRCLHNNVFDLFPLFYLEKIGCYNWGFVAGLYQTYEPWEGSWLKYQNDPHCDYDFTKWFHDLYRPNHRPYDPKEIALIKDFCRAADEDFKKEHE